MNARRGRPRFLPNVNVWQVRAGVALFVVIPLLGIAWGLKGVAGLAQAGQSGALLAFTAGIVLGIAAGGTYALIAATRRGTFFVDDPAEVDRNMKRRIGLGSSIGLGLTLAALVPLLALQLEFVVGGALCGVMLAWAPIAIAAYARLERRRRL